MRTLVKRVFSHIVSASLTAAVIGGLLAYNPLTAVQTDTLGEFLRSLPVESPEQSVVPPAQAGVEARCGGDELMWLACGVYFEARNQSYEGQYWVAQSILNRVHDSRWPNTIEAVVRQGEERKHRCQYSFMCDGKPEHIVNETAWQTAVTIAIEAMEDYYEGEPVTCAHSYHATYVTNAKALAWFATLTRDEQVGEHIFFC